MLDKEFTDKLVELQSKLLPYNARKEPEIYKSTDITKKIKEDEEIQQFKYEDSIKVSNYGRVWVDGLYGLKKGDGVYYIIKKDGKPEQVHRLVALNYCKSNGRSGDMPVHHIDGNGYNNHYSNLLWVTDAQHTMIHLKDSIWHKENDENYQLKFAGNIFCLTKQNIKLFDGEFEMTNKVIWNGNKKETPHKIKFNTDGINRDFSRDRWEEINIGGNDLFSGKWSLSLILCK